MLHIIRIDTVLYCMRYNSDEDIEEDHMKVLAKQQWQLLAEYYKKLTDSRKERSLPGSWTRNPTETLFKKEDLQNVHQTARLNATK